VPQSFTQLAILQQLTTFLRSGKYIGDINDTPSKIIHVGHSFGSFLSNALIATTLHLSDGAILTRIAYANLASGTFVEAFALRIATIQAPGKWPGRDNEYLTWETLPQMQRHFSLVGVIARKFSGTLRMSSNLWRLLSLLPLVQSYQSML
jgi:hypothetical protein